MWWAGRRVSPRPRCTPSCAGMAARGWRLGGRETRWCATSVIGLVSFCTSMQRSWAGSCDLAIESRVTAASGRGARLAGSTCSSLSTMPPDLATPGSTRTREQLSDQLPGRLPALLPAAWHHHRTRPHRQWHLLQTALARRLHRPADRRQEDPAVSPQTNGKAERFIRTLLERWAYAAPYPTEHHRAQALPDALDTYNHHRPHRALARRTPLQRVNDLSGTYT
jgi:hypothetical protein